MSQENHVQINYDREIERIDEAISACKRDFEDLVYKRHEFIARKFGMDVMELIDYIVNCNDVPQEAVDTIVSIALKKREQLKKDRYSALFEAIDN